MRLHLAPTLSFRFGKIQTDHTLAVGLENFLP